MTVFVMIQLYHNCGGFPFIIISKRDFLYSFFKVHIAFSKWES